MMDETVPTSPAAEEATRSEADEASAVRQKLEAENAEMKDRVLRTLAEMENLRKRTERDVADAKAYAVTAFARDLLNVADNLGRALAAHVEQKLEADAALKTLEEGVAMTERELLSTLAKHGVQKIEPKGERFDPNIHQAMFEVPDTSVPSGTVVQVVQAGYTISGRVLRPALVGVAKGGPKPQAAAGTEQNGVDKTA